MEASQVVDWELFGLRGKWGLVHCATSSYEPLHMRTATEARYVVQGSEMSRVSDVLGRANEPRGVHLALSSYADEAPLRGPHKAATSSLVLRCSHFPCT